MINSFFDILKDILTKESNGTLRNVEGFNKHMSNFMLVRYLSMKDSLIPYAQILNRYQCTLTAEQMYQWAYDNIPKQRSPWIKYISKKKKKEKKKGNN